MGFTLFNGEDLLHLLFHMDDGHHLKLLILDAVDDSVAAFMNFTQAGLDEFMNGVTFGWHARRMFDAVDQALDLQAGVMLGVTGDEVADGPQITACLR